MKIWIPTVGDRIRLLEDWTFEARRDYRNSDILRDLGSYWKPTDPLPKVTVPKGTELRVARVYIRGNYRDYDSVTFHAPVRQEFTGARKGKRFFAGLADVNNIEAEKIP